ncbi:MAG TPA: glycosyltransferase [Rhodanobacteraceae bacterium]
MLSFLRARVPQSSPSPLRELRWSGNELILQLDPALRGERIAVDLDGSFFADVPVDADGNARFLFPFAPLARAQANLMPRRGRDGEPLAAAPLAIRFGRPGTSAAVDVAEDLGDLGQLVRFGVDCASQEVAIVVPVYGAAELVERCLDSVLVHTTGRARLIVIDDASPDAAIAPLLARYASCANVRVLRNEANRGFTATANRGIAESGRADVVLLNGDTEVGPNWLTGLRRAAATAADVATITAVSDNAGAFSVPELEHENTTPASWSLDETARALWQQAGHAYPALPTGNGFCLYIRRAVIDAVGVLDEAAFPQGYGEENDFCQRASARGMRHLIAGNVYVRHARSASFGHERREQLGATGMAILRERWPNYEAEVAATLHSFERRVLDWRVRRVFAAAGAYVPRIRVLGAGDVAPPDRAEWHLAVDGDTTELRRAGNLVASHTRRIDAAAASLDESLWRWLQGHAIEAVVAVGQFPDSLPRISAALGIPFACAARGESVEAASANALAAARSFPETMR